MRGLSYPLSLIYFLKACTVMFMVVNGHSEVLRPPMGYLGDGRLGLNFGRFGRIDPKYFGRWEIDLVREQRNGRNRKIHGSTYLGAGRLAVIKVGDWEIETPHRGPLYSHTKANLA